MKTRDLRLLGVFLLISVIENIGFPIAASHGNVDFMNTSILANTIMGTFAFLGAVFVLVLSFTKSSSYSVIYRIGKYSMPLLCLILLATLIELVPFSFTLVASLIFVVHLTGIMLAAFIMVGFVRNQVIS